MHNYKKLLVWKKAVHMATEVYRLTELYPYEEKFGLISQIRRSVISISSNIAEGAGRGSDSEFRYFLNIAYGSAYELETQLIISNNLNYLRTNDFELLSNQIEELQKMLFRLIQNLT